MPRRFPCAARLGAVAVLSTALAVNSAATEPTALPNGVTLGMTVPQLQQTQPSLKRVPRPARLAGGLVGSWSGDAVEVAGVMLTPTFFFVRGELRRVEYLAQEAGPAPFAPLLAWARRSWGTELATEGPEGAYASWSAEDVDAYLQRPGGTPEARVRLVIKTRVMKDAAEL